MHLTELLSTWEDGITVCKESMQKYRTEQEIARLKALESAADLLRKYVDLLSKYESKGKWIVNEQIDDIPKDIERIP